MDMRHVCGCAEYQVCDVRYWTWNKNNLLRCSNKGQVKRKKIVSSLVWLSNNAYDYISDERSTRRVTKLSLLLAHLFTCAQLLNYLFVSI